MLHHACVSLCMHNLDSVLTKYKALHFRQQTTTHINSLFLHCMQLVFEAFLYATSSFFILSRYIEIWWKFDFELNDIELTSMLFSSLKSHQ